MPQTQTSADPETKFNWMALTSVTVTRPIAKSNVRVRTTAPIPSRTVDAMMRADTFNFSAFA